MAIKFAIPDISDELFDRSTGLMNESWYRFFEEFERQTHTTVDDVSGQSSSVKTLQDFRVHDAAQIVNLQEKLTDNGNVQFTASLGLVGGGRFSDAAASGMAIDFSLPVGARGSVLFKSAGAWTVLAPGTAGTVLTTGGPGADPTWAAAGGGGSAEPREGSVTKPVVANFTAVNFVGSTTAVDGVTGIILTDPVLASQFRVLEQTAAVPATPWSLYGRFDYQPQVTSQGGLVLRNSGTGRLVFWGRYQGGLLQTYWNSVTSFNSNPFGPVNVSGVPIPKWWRIDNDGVNLKFWYSPDGRDWFTEANLNPTLAAFIGSVDRVGFGIELDNSSATDRTWLRCSSFSFVAPT